MKTISMITRTLVGIAFPVVFGMAAQGAHTLRDGLAAWYPFSGDARDESGNGNDGVVMGATLTTDRFGNPNSAYSFDGIDDLIRVANDPSLEIDDLITLSAWVNHVSTTSPQHILNKSDLRTGYRLAAWRGNPVGNSLEFYDTNEDQATVADGEFPIIGAWTHVAATWDGTTMRIFRDGVLKGEAPFSGSIGTANSDLFIGVIDPDPFPIQGYFHGSIDDVRVYHRALSADEIFELSLVPEPAASCLCAMGLLTLLSRRRRGDA